MKFTNAPVAWTPDTVCDSDKFNREIKEKMDDIEKGLSSKLITSTRIMTADPGDVSYNGVGFTPTSIQALTVIDGTVYFSVGFADSSKAGQALYEHAAVKGSGAYLILIASATNKFQTAIVKSYDADGFTLTWTKTGTPTGTVKLSFLCFR